MKRLADVERETIVAALEETKGHQREAARGLGISRWSLARRIAHFGIGVEAIRLAAIARAKALPVEDHGCQSQSDEQKSDSEGI